jgi:hypothetical protein
VARLVAIRRASDGVGMSNERAVQPDEIAGVPIPHTSLAIAAAEAAHASLPEIVTAYASGLFVFRIAGGAA